MKEAEIKVTLEDGKTKIYNLEKELRIKEEKLDSHLMHQPGKYARFAKLTAHAWAIAKRAKYALEEYEHKLDLEIRAKVAAKKDAKITENQIKALIKTDSKRMALVNALIGAEEQADVVQAATKAFEERHDCLLALGYRRRMKFEEDLSIKERKSKD